MRVITWLLFWLGGQLGLWIGISIITLAETLELICDLLRMFFSIGKRIPRHHRELKKHKERMAQLGNGLYMPSLGPIVDNPEAHSMLHQRQNGGVAQRR